jgi:hypothetical protein
MSAHTKPEIVTNTGTDLQHIEQPLVCAECSAVYADHRWTLSLEIIREKKQSHVQSTTCPACSKKRDGAPEGYLHLNGQFFLYHREEVEKLIQDEVARAGAENALDQIIDFDREDKEMLTVATTTRQMALRLGHTVEATYGGIINCGFSHDQKVVRVWWHKD